MPQDVTQIGMFQPRVVFAVCMMLSCLFAGLWDVWVIAHGRPNDTVSRVLQEWSVAYPMLPLALGILLGHIFWPTWQLVRQ